MVLTLVALEICLSTLSFLYYPRLSISDPVIGSRYRPTAGAVGRREPGGDINEIAIKSDGFRDDEFMTREDGVQIMLLGDSMTFGLEADQNEIYPALLEGLLRRHFGRSDIDVMNLAIPSFSTAQELVCLRLYEPKCRPRAVVLQMSEWNDFEENSWIFRGRYRPHFLFRNGQVVEGPPPNAFYTFLNVLRDSSALFYLITNFTEVLTVSQSLTGDEQIALTTQILEQIHLYLEGKGIPLFLLYVRDPNHQADGDDAARAFSEQRDVPLRLVPLVAEEQVDGIGHWNAKGHRHAAETVADMLLAAIPGASGLRR